MSPESYVQLPQDSTGKKLRSIKRTVEGVIVEEQVVRLECHQKADVETWAVVVLDSAVGASKHHLAIFNASGTNKWLEIILVKVSMQASAAISGFPMSYRLYRTTARGSAGTALTPSPFNTGNASLPSGITLETNVGSPTLGACLAVSSCTAEDTGGNTEAVLFEERLTQQPLLIKEAEGITIQQYGTAGAGVVEVTVIFRIRAKET